MDARVYFHTFNQFLDISGRLAFKVPHGKLYELQITFQDVFQIEYKNVANGIILYESDKKCTHHSFDDCMYNRLATLMKNDTEDRCTVPWILDDSNICSKMSDMNKTFWISWDRSTNKRKDCAIPCHISLVSVGTKNERENKKSDNGLLMLYYSSKVIKSQEHYMIPSIKLIGQLGGYIGMYRLCLFFLSLRLNFLTKKDILFRNNTKN